MGAPAYAGAHVGIPVDVLEADFGEVEDIADVALAWGKMKKTAKWNLSAISLMKM